ncbi:HAMP domain-containing sensor histidine kinase [Roseomonas sp. KE2513]|uniref:sensor histidine kinase n=1 Tax=Roseomonas sp. KE2513 TaxID=2479202 RepID=UPI00281509A2|nr:HAMP domain-containing sensor histidine kinase [Roseomonas sp. KE2513]
MVAAEIRRAPAPRLIDSAGFRFAVFFAVMFLLGGVAFAGIVWWNTAGGLDRQTDAAIRADVAALMQRYRDAGRAGVEQAITFRLQRDGDAQDLYRLTDAAGRQIAGNLAATPDELDGPAPDAEALRWLRAPLVREGALTEARLYRADLSNGDRLIVGRDVEERLRLRELLGRGLGWAASASCLIALIGALLLRRALQSRLRPAAETVQAIAQGDLSQRVPLSGKEDEFDRLGRTMNAMLDRIGTLMAGIRGVSDAIAHDLRTPVARARGRLEEALDGDAETMRRAIETGLADLDGMTRIFQAVLRITEAEAGARRAAFGSLDLAPLLADAAELYDAIAEARGVALRVDLPESLPLTGDRDLLLQAVANLLDNAVKFSPAGGVIRLSAGLSAGALRITVADEGPGLSPADRARAGERFFRADSARATPGYGLGLSLVRAVAGLHGGELVLTDTRPGASPPGLSATLILPPHLSPAAEG